jgi:hypothetical protein
LTTVDNKINSRNIMYIEIFYVILIIFPLSCFFSQCFRSKKFETARYTFKEQCFIISKLLTIED